MDIDEIEYITDIVHDITTGYGCHNCVISGKSVIERTRFVYKLISILSNNQIISTDFEGTNQVGNYEIAQLKYELASSNIHVCRVKCSEQESLSLTDQLLKCLSMDPQAPNAYASIEQSVDSILSESKQGHIVVFMDSIQGFCKSERDLLQFQTIISRLIGKAYFICINQYVEGLQDLNDSYIDSLNKILCHSHDFRHIHV